MSSSPRTPLRPLLSLGSTTSLSSSLDSQDSSFPETPSFSPAATRGHTASSVMRPETLAQSGNAPSGPKLASIADLLIAKKNNDLSKLLTLPTVDNKSRDRRSSVPDSPRLLSGLQLSLSSTPEVPNEVNTGVGVQRRSSVGEGKMKRRYSRRLSTPAPVPELKETDNEEEREDPLEFLMKHQQDKLMYNRLRADFEITHAYVACTFLGLCFGSLFAIVLKFFVFMFKLLIGWVITL